MISHDRAQELISARIDAPLKGAEQRELQAHLATCADCQLFLTRASGVARELQAMPRLAASPAVTRAVMSAVFTESNGWDWLRKSLQALSSPGMAVATGMALVLALAGALIVALNAPGGSNLAVAPESTVAAIAEAPMPTAIPTETPAPPPTEAAKLVVTETPAALPTATSTPGRTIVLKSTSVPAKTPAPKPTATQAPTDQAPPPQDVPAADSPPIEPGTVDAPVYDEAPAEDPTLAMANEAPVEGDVSAELAQEAVIEQPAEVVDQAVEPAPVVEEAAVVADDAEQASDNPKKDNSGKKSEEVAAEVEPTRPIGPVPIEAIAALEGAGNAPDIYLPPAPLDPLLPDQSFLPVSPTPEWSGTPTPESDPITESESPQLAEDTSGDLGVMALLPEAPAEVPVVAEAPDVTTSETDNVNKKGKRDKSNKDGDSFEQQQSAFSEEPMGWSSAPLDVPQSIDVQQTADVPVEDPAAASGQTGDAAVVDQSIAPAQVEEVPLEVDAATGMQIDPATGYLIDPTTGYLLDRVNGRIIDPRTSFEVHPMTGLLIDPASGALLDPNTLVVVIPAGFGDDQPGYVPGSDEMHGQIEAVVDDTYNNASIKLEPPTDGPVQPIGDIVVPTTSGDALEIS